LAGAGKRGRSAGVQAAMTICPQNQWRADQFRAYVRAKAELVREAMGADSLVGLDILRDACEWECLFEAVPAGNA
jgi:hypothetical protein